MIGYAASGSMPFCRSWWNPLEHHGHLHLEQGVRAGVLAMSSATIDRLFSPIRKTSGRDGEASTFLAEGGEEKRCYQASIKMGNK